MLFFALALAAAAPATTFEADTWGIRLARTGTLAALLPMMVAKETEELVASQKMLSDADKAQLRAVASARARQEIERVMAVEGNAYAASCSI